MARGLINKISCKIDKYVKNHGRTLSKVFVWLFAVVLISCGFISLLGFIIDFIRTGSAPYTSINNFIKEYFSASTIAAFGAVGILLIDKDGSGIPDKFECELESLKEKFGNAVKRKGGEYDSGKDV